MRKALSVWEDDPANNIGTCGLPTHRTAFNIACLMASNAVCTLCNMIWVNLNIQELQEIHYGVYWCTDAFLVLGHLQES